MIKKSASIVVLALFLGAASADATDGKKHGNNGAPLNFTVWCVFSQKKPVGLTYDTALEGIQVCLLKGGHPVGVTPNFGKKRL